MTTLLYQMRIANLRRCLEMKTDESVEAFAVLKFAMKVFDGRWKASSEYPRLALATD
jgi:hypothetical protein